MRLYKKLLIISKNVRMFVERHGSMKKYKNEYIATTDRI